MTKHKYIVYYDNKFEIYDNWKDASIFIEFNPGCRYQKFVDEKEKNEFINKWKGKPNFKNKTYIVINNNSVIRFNKWNECKEYIDLNPNSKYKSFENEKDAQTFINNNIHNSLTDRLQDTLYCFLGTSYNKSNKRLSYSFVAVKNETIVMEDVGCILNETNIGQLRGEIEACINSIKFAISNKEERVIIVYSNLAIEMFANKSWNAKTKETIDYKDNFFELQKYINIDFININKYLNSKKFNQFHERAISLSNNFQ